MCQVFTSLEVGSQPLRPLVGLQLEYPLGSSLLQNRLQLLMVLNRSVSALRYRVSLMRCFKYSLSTLSKKYPHDARFKGSWTALSVAPLVERLVSLKVGDFLWKGPQKPNLWSLPYRRYLVDPASSHMLVSKIKPCKSKYMLYS